MSFFELVGYMVVGCVGLGCVIALFWGVIAWEFVAKQRDRERRQRREIRDLDWQYGLPSARKHAR